MDEHILKFDGVSKIYGKNWVALCDVSFELYRGEFVFLIGPSGAGKTTLLKTIYLAEFPDRGEVIFLGFSSKKITEKDIPQIRRRLGIVFQDFKLLEHKTAYENIELPLIVRGMRKKERKERVSSILKDLGLVEKANLYPYQLSGGEKQRIAIGRALANSPLLLLADEPTGNLDPVTGEEIMDILLRINKRGTAIIMATHNMNIVEEHGGRKLILENGKIVADIR